MSSGVEQSGDAVVRSAARGALVSMAGKVAYLLTRIALPPFVLHHVGLDEYGIWSMAFVLIGYLGMGAFGVSNVYIRYVAAHRARGDVDAINRLLTTGLAFTVAVATAMLAAVAAALPLLVPALGVPAAMAPLAHEILFAACAAFLVDLAFGAFSNVLLGLERVTAHTVVWVGGSALEGVLLVALLHAGLGVHALPVAFAVRLVVAAAASAALCFRALPGLRVGPRWLDRASLRLFLGYGGIVQLSGTLGILLYSVEKLIAAVALGPAAAGLFDIGEKLAVMGSGIPASLNGVLLAPVARAAASSSTSNGADGASRGAGDFLVVAARWVSLPAGVLLGFLAAFAPALITAWMGVDARLADAAFILSVTSVAFHAHVTTGPASMWYRGAARPSRELFYPLLQAALVALLVVAGFALAGRSVRVLAVAVAAAMVASALGYLAWTARSLGVRFARVATAALVPGLVPYAVAAACRVAIDAVSAEPAAAVTSRAAAFAVLVPGAAAYAAAMAAVAWRMLLDDGEKARVRGAVARLLPGAPALAAAGRGGVR